MSGTDGSRRWTVKFSDAVLNNIITSYTREAGVRQCERLIRKLCSKIARTLVETKKLISVDTKNIEKYLGPRKFLADDVNHVDQSACSGFYS